MKFLTNEQQKPHENAKFCYILKKIFEDKYGKDTIRDHCYYSGEYRYALHNTCNLKCSIPKEITIIQWIKL